MSHTKKEHRAIATERIRDYLFELLGRSVCMDCCNPNPLVLQFDHRDPKEKKYNITDMMTCGYGVKTLESEIEKCDIVCANCHTIRTQKMFGSWKLKRFVCT